jgi:hypothetical protein
MSSGIDRSFLARGYSQFSKEAVMKKYVITILVITIVFFSSCIYFQYINQPSIALPNQIFTVSIAVTSEGGEYEPYFGVCLPVGWTIPGDTIQCSGEYSKVIYHNDSLSIEQENISPSPIGYYWWVGNGMVDTTAIGAAYADLNIQTDNQIGVFSIDYMLGDSYNGVNYQRSDNHLIQIAESAIITSIIPDQGYQNFTIDISIDGFNTHFLNGFGTENVWLSKNGEEIYANSFVVYSNTSLTANFHIPLTAQIGLYDVNVETHIDSIIIKVESFEILPPPPLIFVSPDSLEIVLEPGSTGTNTLTISNSGGSDLSFNISGPNTALQFDGIDDKVIIPPIAPITNNAINQLTLEGWIYFATLNSGIQQFMECLTSTFEIFLEYDEDSLGVRFSICDETGVGHEIKTSQLVVKKWYHIAGTYDGLMQKIYLNGILDNSLNWNNSVIITTGFSLGRDYNHNMQELNGKIDEVRIWSIARTQEEIQSSMYKELLGTEQGLVGYWKLNEGIGDTAFDKSSYGNHGILHNGVTWSDSSAPILSSPDWLNVSPFWGTCNPNSAMDITVSFDATELDTGDYHFTLKIFNNDPFHPEVTIPVHMLVSQSLSIKNEFNLPTEFNLEQNYPNPFNPNTKIRYSVPHTSKVIIKVFDILGNEIETLVNEEKTAGTYEITWYAESLPSGVYFYRLQAESFIETKKMILMK